MIFFARFEASQFGSPRIEPEHLLLGLFRECETLRRITPHSAAEEARRKIREAKQVREKVATSVDLPLSHPAKRVLAYGAEESERLQHSVIAPGHLLLGVLREPSLAADILKESGVTLEKVRQTLADEPSSRDTRTGRSRAGAELRRDLHELVDDLPEHALGAAESVLTHARELPFRPGAGGLPALALSPEYLKSLRQRAGQIRERMRESESTGMAFGAASMRLEQGEAVFESHRFHQGHQLTLVERLRLSEDGRTLHYSIEVEGPKTRQRWSTELDVSSEESKE